VTFSAVPVNVDLLLDDLRKYLASNPEQPNFRRAQLPDIGWRLIEADGKKYLNGKPIEWTVDLNPADGHFDDTKTIEAPLPKAGAWWVQAQLQDGNTSRMILWLADLAIAEKQTESGTLIYVADAVTGSPVPRTDLQFFGWQFNYENQRPRINTSRFADRTDANGLCTPPVTPEQTQNQWLISAKAPDGRTAFTGFGNLWVAQKIEPLAWSPLKIYAITDRPIYRPGHTVNYSLWLRRPLFDGDNNEWAEKPVWIQIRNPQGEAVSEQQLQTDARGAVSGQYALPADAQLGTWTVMAARQVQVVRLIEENGQTRTVNETDREALGGGSFAVEEYRKPEYEVTVKAPEKPVALGEKFTATVSATYYFGAPVSAAKLHYRVERKKNQERWFPAARWDWLYSPGYWWFTGDYQWY
ncbi:MAG: MG2 domain-containing protein, partial [Planctomyces sp.]